MERVWINGERWPTRVYVLQWPILQSTTRGQSTHCGFNFGDLSCHNAAFYWLLGDIFGRLIKLVQAGPGSGPIGHTLPTYAQEAISQPLWAVTQVPHRNVTLPFKAPADPLSCSSFSWLLMPVSSDCQLTVPPTLSTSQAATTPRKRKQRLFCVVLCCIF